MKLPVAHVFSMVALLAGCGDSSEKSPAGPDPEEPGPPGSPESPGPAQGDTFTITIPATGQGIECKIDGATVHVITPPDRLRLVRTSLQLDANVDQLAPGSTVRERCAGFTLAGGDPMHVRQVAPLAFGSFGFELEYGPRSEALRGAVRAELERRGKLPAGGAFDIDWALQAPISEPSFAVDSVSSNMIVGPNNETVATRAEPILEAMFATLGTSQSTTSATLSIGFVCDVVNGFAGASAAGATQPPRNVLVLE